MRRRWRVGRDVEDQEPVVGRVDSEEPGARSIGGDVQGVDMRVLSVDERARQGLTRDQTAGEEEKHDAHSA